MLLVIRKDQNNCWFRSPEDNYKAMHEFLQYILDCCSDPDGYTIVICRKGQQFELEFNRYVHLTGMRKRNFKERQDNILTGVVPVYVWRGGAELDIFGRVVG